LPIERNKKIYRPGNWLGKPYNFFGDYLWDKYKTRVLKLPINAGLSCPNRDGTIDYSGCIFCSEDGSASPTTSGSKHIINQMQNAKLSFKRSEATTKYIAYFQAYTNTYAQVNKLKKLYDIALGVKDITGLMIATRPDCLSDDILNMIAGYKRDDFELWLEIGMQSMHEKSMQSLNRGHSYQKTRETIIKAADKGIPVCVHIILGIPGESWEDMMKTAREISSLPVLGVKIHHLHIIKNTRLEQYFNQKLIKTLSFREYVSCICDFIERLGYDILIHRLMGDRNKESLIAPLWALYKGTVLNEIEKEFNRRGSYQGFLYNYTDIIY